MTTVYDEWRKSEEEALSKGVDVDSVYRGLYNHAASNDLGNPRLFARKRLQAAMHNRLKGRLGDLRSYLTGKFEKKKNMGWNCGVGQPVLPRGNTAEKGPILGA